MYRDTGMYSLYAGTMAQNAPRVARLMVEELRRVRKDGITEEEFLQSKEQLKGSLILSLESTSAKMNEIGKSMLLTDEVRSDEEIVKMVRDVTMDDIRRAIDEVIRPDDITAAYVGKIEDESALRAVTMDG
jgi:predicted Zn-dependent peptidase